MHENSLAAYRELRQHLSRRKLNVAYAILRDGVPVTDRGVAKVLGFGDMNAVRPRITELVQDPDIPIGEVGITRDATTGRTVRLVGYVSLAAGELTEEAE